MAVSAATMLTLALAGCSSANDADGAAGASSASSGGAADGSGGAPSGTGGAISTTGAGADTPDAGDGGFTWPDAAPGAQGWTAICSGSTGPSPCPAGESAPYFRGFNYNLPYAADRETLLYYGGYANPSSIYSNAIWEYSVAAHAFHRLSWTGSTTYSCPTVAQDGVEPNAPYWDGHPQGFFAFDSSRQQTLVTQLLCQGNIMHHTWLMSTASLAWVEAGQGSWDGVERVDATIVYDADHDLYISYGGGNTNNTLTYFDPKTAVWTNHTAEQTGASGSADLPGYLGGGRLIHDSVSHRVFLFGGYRSLGDGRSGINDLWVLEPAAVRWTRLQPSGGVKPPGGTSGQFPWIVFDSNRDRLVDYVDVGVAWQYDVSKNAWSQIELPGGPPIPPPNGQPGYYGGAVGFDPLNDTMVVIKTPSDGSGNGGAPDVWELKF